MNTVNNYNELKKQLIKNGCFYNTNHYAFRFLLLTTVFIAGYVFLLFTPRWWLSMLTIFILGITCIQSCFLAHDAGDGSVTKNSLIKSFLSQFYMTFIAGFSFNYFIELHKFHHKTMTKGSAITSKPVNQYECKVIKKLVIFNPTLFLVITTILRGFTLQLEGLTYLYRKKKLRIDILFIMGHIALWLVIPAILNDIKLAIINYFLVSLVGGTYAGLSLIVNHVSMITSDDFAEKPFMERVGLSTTNLGNNWFSNFIWGGLNNHIEHHLYPSIPVSKLGEARAIVRTYYRNNSLPYHENNLFNSLKGARKYFMSITPEARLMEPLN